MNCGLDPIVWAAVFNGATSTLTVDAVRVTGNAGNTAKAALTLGQLPNAWPSKLDVHELVLYPRALTNTEVDATVAALRSWYGI